MNIRRLQKTDLHDVARLETRVQRDPWRESQILAVADLLEVNYMAWVLENPSQQIVAYLIVQHVVDAFEILTIGVDAQQQGRGLGQALWQYAWDDMRRVHTDTHRCFLEVRRSNLAAQALYAKCGFVPIGLRRNYYQNPSEDAFILEINEPKLP